MGQVVRKLFEGKYYHGTVTNYQKKAGWYALLDSARMKWFIVSLQDMAWCCSPCHSPAQRPTVDTRGVRLLVVRLHRANLATALPDCSTT